MEATDNGETSARIPRILQLQPTLHRTLLHEVTTTHKVDQERIKIRVEQGTRRCIPSAQNSMHFTPNIDQLSAKPTTSNGNRRIRPCYRSMHFTRKEWELAPNCLPFQKVLSSRRKLRRTRQRTTCHCLSIATLESVCRKLLRTHNFHRPQEPHALHDIKTA